MTALVSRRLAGPARFTCAPRARRAFTFLEIMFVVVIIGILMAIVGPRLAGKSKKAQIAACEAQMRNIKTGLSQYEMHTGDFPSSSQGLKALIERPSDVDEKKYDGPYLEGGAIPKDPWGQDYRYKCPGESKRDYDLWSAGPDKQDGTDDDVKSWKEEKK